jgi:hypothetical protein
MEEDELVSEEEAHVRGDALLVGCQSLKEFKEPRSESVQAKKNATVDRQRKRQKRKADEDQLGIRRKAMDKAKVRLSLACVLLSPPLIVDCRCCQTVFVSPWPNRALQTFCRYQGNVQALYLFPLLIPPSRGQLTPNMLPLWTRNPNRRGEDARKPCKWRAFVFQLFRLVAVIVLVTASRKRKKTRSC